MQSCSWRGLVRIKNFALNGLATGESGMLVLTDPDLIEKSSLSSQFLFRTEDIRVKNHELN